METVPQYGPNKPVETVLSGNHNDALKSTNNSKRSNTMDQCIGLRYMTIAIAATCIALPNRASSVADEIVDIDGLINSSSDPVVIQLDQGSYAIEPISQQNGGEFTAVLLWSSVSGCNSSGMCNQGWRHNYCFFSPDTGTVCIPFDGTWQTAELAFATATGATFEIKGTSNVSFWHPDPFPTDNTGGISLRIKQMTLLGDVNCDGEVNLLDVEPFVEALSSGEYEMKADINQDGVVDLLDVAPFVDLLTSP